MTNTPQIAITGGSGHLGACLIQKLLSRGFSVKAQYLYNAVPITHPKLHWMEGDINNKEAVTALISDCKVVIHCAGLISIGDKKKSEVYKVNVDGTATVVNECIRQGDIRLIHISSSSAVKPGKKNAVYDEKQPYTIKDDFAYPHSKALAEQLVLQSVKNDQLDAIILRPTSMVGPPDYGPSLLGQTILDLSKGALPVITSGGYDLVDVRDVSETIIKSIEKGQKGEVYLLGGQYITVKEIARAANNNKIPIKISIDFLRWILPLINLYCIFFNMKWPLTKESLLTLKNAPVHMNSEKATKAFGHNSRPPSESIKNLREWFQTTKIN